MWGYLRKQKMSTATRNNSTITRNETEQKANEGIQRSRQKINFGAGGYDSRQTFTGKLSSRMRRIEESGEKFVANFFFPPRLFFVFGKVGYKVHW